MAPFEALYCRKCRTPLNLIEPGERRYFGIDFVTKAEEQVHIIQYHMKAAQSRQRVMLIKEEDHRVLKWETTYT